jgi:hypothetical protein
MRYEEWNPKPAKSDFTMGFIAGACFTLAVCLVSVLVVLGL